jgi:hypothetical protein
MHEKVIFDRLTVLPDRVEAYVRIIDQEARDTSTSLIDQVLQQYPTVPYHACRNSEGPTFGAVMERTSVPHLLEHLVIDIQAHEHARSEASDIATTFTGTTQWSADDPDVAIVRVSFLDDLIALGAFKKALHFINHALA